ncbi:hypothetical protein CR513_43817, partial [Mucuna pruriens]
ITNNNHCRVHTIPWDNLCRPKACGGLGLKSSRKFNTVFMMKMGWSVIRSKYKCGGSIVFVVNVKRSGYNLWRGLKLKVTWSGELEVDLVSALKDIPSDHLDIPSFRGGKVLRDCDFCYEKLPKMLVTNEMRCRRATSNDASCPICKEDLRIWMLNNTLSKQVDGVAVSIKHKRVYNLSLSLELTYPIISWIPPPTDQLKLNCDGSVLLNSTKAATGGVLRDHRGRLLQVLVRALLFMYSHEQYT